MNPVDEATEADESLGDKLDRHLAALQAGKKSPALDADSRELVPVVDRLHALSQYLISAKPETTEAHATSDIPCSPATSDVPVVPTSPAVESVGKYQVKRPLGRGGQASALLAFDPDLKRHVVIKLYRACSSEQQEVVLREGQALARVRSPYVAQVFGVERHEGVPYLVVEYIPGDNFADRHKKQPYDVASAIELMARLAEGLAAVHACGLLHRDIKPANILIGDDGVPRLVDFGLAAAIASEQLHGISGTLAYMPPEQARGESERVDPRSDIFGLGAVFYELLTGRPPYQGNSTQKLLELARAGDVVSPKQINSNLPDDVVQICQRCLAKDPGQRFSSALDLKATLDTCRNRGVPASLPAPPVSAPSSNRGRLIAVALLLVAVIAALVALLSQRTSTIPTDSASAKKTPPDVPAMEIPREIARHPDGRPLHRSFPIDFSIVGGTTDPGGTVHINEGETVRFRLEAGADCYVGIWYTDEQGNVVQLYPNRFAPQQLLRKGEKRTIPEDDKYAIRATPAKGREYLHVFASTKEWTPPPTKTRAGPFDAYDVFATPEDKDSLNKFLRGLVLQAADGNAGTEVRMLQVSEVVVPFEVKTKQ